MLTESGTKPIYAAFADSLPVHVCVLDGSGIVAWTNAAWTRFGTDNGGSPGCLGPGLDYLAICAASQGREQDDGLTVAAGLRRLLDGETATFSHVYPCHAPTVKRWFKLLVSRLDDGAVLLHVPIDPPDGPEQTARRLLSTVAHELRTPMTAIAGYSDLLSDDAAGLATAKARTYAAAISRSTLYLSGLLDDMMDLERAGQGAATLTESPACLAELAAEAVRLSSATARRHGVRLTSAVPSAAWAMVDRRRLIQVLVNLLVNAAKFSPDGSEVLLSGWRASGWVLAVRDQGIGMAAEDIPALLQPYGRAEAARTAGIPGLGLGLPLCKALVDLHDGCLRIDSTPGAGTTVEVVLPAWRTLPPPSGGLGQGTPFIAGAQARTPW